MIFWQKNKVQGNHHPISSCRSLFQRSLQKVTQYSRNTTPVDIDMITATRTAAISILCKAGPTILYSRCSLTYRASNIFIDRWKRTFVLDFAVKVWISVIPGRIGNFKSYRDNSRGSVRWHALSTRLKCTMLGCKDYIKSSTWFKWRFVFIAG